MWGCPEGRPSLRCAEGRPSMKCFEQNMQAPTDLEFQVSPSALDDAVQQRAVFSSEDALGCSEKSYEAGDSALPNIGIISGRSGPRGAHADCDAAAVLKPRRPYVTGSTDYPLQTGRNRVIRPSELELDEEQSDFDLEGGLSPSPPFMSPTVSAAPAPEHRTPSMSRRLGNFNRPGLHRSATGISIMSGVQKRLARLEASSTGVLAPSVSQRTQSRKRVKGTQQCRVPLVVVVTASSVLLLVSACLSMYVVLESYLYRMETAALESETLDALKQDIHDLTTECRSASLVTSLVLIVLSLVVGLVVGRRIAQPVNDVGYVMELMGHVGFSEFVGTEEAMSLLVDDKGAPHSRILDISELQAAVGRVLHSVEMFTLFLPKTVVRGIVRGDERSTRLHVRKRQVSILFSDIKDFTSISESLSQEDLIFLLTRYLSVMTRIVESFEGVVAEILGDGLLVFWNTPDDVEDHAAKACAAALAQIQAVKSLNEEWQPFGLPKIELRIGVHTGEVLTGNIGSEAKMKFGCMGDPINLASRLEGLCKFYGVNIICSADTYELLPRGEGFFCRQLDLVQVKGKNEPTRIFELVGVVDEDDVSHVGASRALHAARTISNVSHDALKESAQALEKVDGFNGNRLMAALSYVGRQLSIAKLESSPSAQSLGTTNQLVRQSSASAHFKRKSVSAELLNTVEERDRNTAKLYETALEAFQQGRFVQARDLAEEYLAERPGDLAAKRLLESANERFAAEGSRPLSSGNRWTGVRVMDEK